MQGEMSHNCLVLRTPSGISGDMLLAGLARIADLNSNDLNQLVESLGVDALRGCLRIEQTAIKQISGWKAVIDLPAEHAHRSFAAMRRLIRASALAPGAKDLAEATFATLAQAEADIHGKTPDEITFHEVGALDSILDICLVAAIYDRLSPARFICSPLPVCDGVIRCAHGLISAPAPAVLQLLVGVPVYGIDSSGETVTPTAIALLKTLGARFEGWPAIRVQKVVRVFGGRTVPNVPNGAIFVLGEPHGLQSTTPTEWVEFIHHRAGPQS
jgi:uncharacterized protein (DUF111 family)